MFVPRPADASHCTAERPGTHECNGVDWASQLLSLSAKTSASSHQDSRGEPGVPTSRKRKVDQRYRDDAHAGELLVSPVITLSRCEARLGTPWCVFRLRRSRRSGQMPHSTAHDSSPGDVEPARGVWRHPRSASFVGTRCRTRIPGRPRVRREVARASRLRHRGHTAANGPSSPPGPQPPSPSGRLFPTPRTSDANGAGPHGEGGLDLRTAISLLPTPTASDGTKGSPNQRHGNGDMTLPSAAASLMPTMGVGTAGAPGRRPGKGRCPPASAQDLPLWTEPIAVPEERVEGGGSTQVPLRGGSG